MKVCMIGASMSLCSGHSKPAFELARWLLIEGHDVTLISTPLSKGIEQEHNLLLLNYPELKELRLIIVPGLDSGTLQNPSVLGEHSGSQVIHAWTAGALKGLPLSYKTDKRVFSQITTDYVSLQDLFALGPEIALSFVMGQPKILKQIVNRHHYRVLTDKCTRLVSATQYMTRRMTLIGVPSDKIVYLPLGVSTWKNSFISKPKDDGDLLFMYFGWLSPMRGFRDLLLAFEIVKNRVPHARLLIANPGNHFESKRMMCLIGRHPMADAIRILPWQSDIRTVLRSVTGVVLPFRGTVGYAQPPLVVAEAMEAETPVISTNVGSVPEFIEHNETGLVVNPGDIEGLAQRMLSLRDREFAGRLSRNARLKIQTNHNWSNIVDKYIQLYQNAEMK